MTQYFLGMDVGGTKTHALVADENGEGVGFGQAGGGNPEGKGYDGLTSVMESALNQALRMARIPVDPAGLPAPVGLDRGRRGTPSPGWAGPGSPLAGAGFGIGGYDWPCDDPPTRQAIRQLGLSCPVEVVNDTIIGLLAGAEQGWGVAVVAGTGSNCRGRDRLGGEGRVTGEGIHFGEFGGGSELVWKAVHAVNYEWMRRGPATQLTGLFLKQTGARDAAELMEWLAREKTSTDPAWAKEILLVAEAGDPVARELIEWSGRELGEMACAVIRQLDLADQAFEIVLIGSMFKSGELLIEALRRVVLPLAPGARLVRLEAPPAVGGVLLAMQAAGRLPGSSQGTPTQEYGACRKRLIESSRRLILEQGG